MIGASLLGAKESRTFIAPDRISLFTVPLRCGAAPEIGCGPISKPILLQLEGDPAMTQAWLTGTGTVEIRASQRCSRRSEEDSGLPHSFSCGRTGSDS
jgi:hypothetical protein